MSKKTQTGIICALIAGKDFIFEDEDTIQEIYGLGREMFNVPNRHLETNELRSLQAMMSALEKTKDYKTWCNILEGRQQTSYAAGRSALTKWFKEQGVNNKLKSRIDPIWEDMDVTPLKLIQLAPEDGFPNINDADTAKEDIALAIFGKNATSTGLRGNFREALSPILHHQWERHRKVFKRAEKALPSTRQNAISACKCTCLLLFVDVFINSSGPVAIENETRVTPKMLREATQAVKKYSNAVQWFPLELEKAQGVAELEEFLKHVVVTAVAKAKGIPKEKLAPEISNSKESSGSASE
jgi:hypothetical protein